MTRREAEALGRLVIEQLCGPRADLAPWLLAAAITDLSTPITEASPR